MFYCVDLILAGCQVLTKATPSFPSSAGQGRQNIIKDLGLEIRAGRDQSLTAVMGKTDSNWRKIILLPRNAQGLKTSMHDFRRAQKRKKDENIIFIAGYYRF